MNPIPRIPALSIFVLLPLAGLATDFPNEAHWPVVASVTVENPSPFSRPDELVRLSLADFGIPLEASSVQGLVASQSGRVVPSQLSDADGDGEADDLLLLLDMGAGESRQIDIIRDETRAKAGAFPRRAHAEISRRIGGAWKGRIYEGGEFVPVTDVSLPGQLGDHNQYFRYEGPGWESDKVGFRLYLDHRNAIDIFGKRVPSIILPEVGQDGYDSYHEPAPWGMDILKVGEALGPGGFGEWDGTSAHRVAVTDATRLRIVEDGPLQASFRIDYTGWQTSAGKRDLPVKVSIAAGQYLSRLSLGNAREGSPLVTGLPRHPEAAVHHGPTDIPGYSWTWLATYGRQSLDGQQLGLVVFVRRTYLEAFTRDEANELVVFRRKDGELAYHIGAVWEGRSEMAATEPAFLDFVRETAERLNRQPRVRVASAVLEQSLKRTPPARYPEIWTRQLADSILARRGDTLSYGSFDPETRSPASWRYTTGLLALAMKRAGEALERPAYAAWADATIDSFIDSAGNIATYRLEEFNIDKINSGKLLLLLHEQTGEARYRLAAERLLEQLERHPRTSGGAFWHKAIYPWQVWLDGVYMAGPFLAHSAQLFDRPGYVEDVLKEFTIAAEQLYDPETGLFYHGWDEKRAQPWADPQTGLSPTFWGRGMGWFAMALVDTLDYLPADAEAATRLRAILSRFAAAIERWQDPATGLWSQIVHERERTGNYLEASASSMFVYTLAKGVNRGYLNGHYADAARKGYDGMVREFVRMHPDGSLSVDGICEVAGLGVGRDGSYAYYMTEPVVKNDPKGLGPFLMAGVELSRLARPAEARVGWEAAGEILRNISDPVFPEARFPIGAYGRVRAEGDVSAAIAAAIAACHAAGGGMVVIPAGRYETGPIHLKSNVNLHLEEGSVLLFKTDPTAYLPQVLTRWEGVELMNYSPLIYAYEAENVAVTGSGLLDGRASTENWWSWKGRSEFGWKAGMPEQSAARQRLFRMAEDGVPVGERIFGQGDYLRPSFIQPYRSRGVLIEGVTLYRSPMWEIHPVLCENVTVRNVTIVSHGPNNDGCNPESSRNVLIEGCLFDTGDDCIAIKSGRNADGRRLNVPSENIIIRDCTMKDGHGGVVIGSEISGGCRNVFVEDCRMDSPQLDRAIRIKTNSIRGGLIENILVRNVTIGQVAESVLRVNFEYEEGDVSVFTPVVRNIQLENVSCQQARLPLFLVGYERSPVRDILLRNCHFYGVKEPSVLSYVTGLVYEGTHQAALPPTDQWGRLTQ